MNRRTFLTAGAGGMSSVLTGCGGRYVGNPTQIPRWKLLIYPRTRSSNGMWKSNIEMKNDYNSRTSFHNVMVCLYSESGNLIAQTDAGTVDSSTTVMVETELFPHLITAKTDESPCEDHVTIDIAYWDGVEPERLTTAYRNEWEYDQRRCNEPLPPELPDTDSNTTDGRTITGQSVDE